MSTTRDTSQDALRRRLEAMGIEVWAMPGGRCLLGRMRLQRRIFETTTYPIRIDEVLFATLGSGRAKCLQPRALFQLPILRMLDCPDATGIEARIHLAWQRHLAQLDRSESWLRDIGTRFEHEEDHSQLAFPIAGEHPEARARMIDPHRVILPSPGPLHGITLRRAEDRVLRIDPHTESAVDLEIDVSNRLAELVRLEERLVRRSLSAPPAAPSPAEPRPAKQRSPTVLVVGPRVTRERPCLESLRVRGYDVVTAAGEREAIIAFDRSSPELVLADVQLGRADGIDLIHSLRQVPGVEEVPVVLLDGRRREERREAARRMGAAGYLVYPIDVARIAERLARIVEAPGRRRFTRYQHRVAVNVEGEQAPVLATAIGRGGMFLATEEEIPTRQVRSCRLALPEVGASVGVEAEVLYRARSGPRESQGLGLRFNAFEADDRAVFIEYLRGLQPEPTLPSL